MQPWNGQVRKKVEVHPSNPKHILYSEREFLQSGISHTTEHRLLGILQVFITHMFPHRHILYKHTCTSTIHILCMRIETSCIEKGDTSAWFSLYSSEWHCLCSFYVFIYILYIYMSCAERCTTIPVALSRLNSIII